MYKYLCFQVSKHVVCVGINNTLQDGNFLLSRQRAACDLVLFFHFIASIESVVKLLFGILPIIETSQKLIASFGNRIFP